MRKYVTPRGGLLLSALFLALLAPLPASGQSLQSLLKENPEFLKAFRPVVEHSSQATVEVLSKGKPVALGTVVKSDGLILTLASELNEAPVVKLADGRKLKASVVALEDRFNLALLKIQAVELPAVDWKPSQEVSVGSWAVSVGPDRKPVAVGVVSVPMRKMPVFKSGKPISSDNQGFLGVELDIGKKEVLIEKVSKGSGASKAGMRPGDVIIGVMGKEVTDGESLRNLMQGTKPGDKVDVKVRRGEMEIELRVTLGPRPLSRNEIQNNMGSELSKVKSGFPVVLQHDSIVKPRECGGPLVDLEGKVIGINVARAGRTESYAIPTEAVLPLLEEMIAGKHTPPGPELQKVDSSK